VDSYFTVAIGYIGPKKRRRKKANQLKPRCGSDFRSADETADIIP